MQDAACLGLVHGDDPERCYGEGGGRGGSCLGTHVRIKDIKIKKKKTSILQRSAFFMVQLSHPYITPGKTITLTRWTFVGQVMFLLFNMLPRLVISIKIK